MKRFFLGLCMFAGAVTGMAQNSYKVTFENKTDNPNLKVEKVYLFSIEDKMAIDSAACVNGQYVMQGTTQLPKLASVCATANGYNVIAAFVLDNEPIKVTVDKGITVEGSETNARMQQITKAIDQGGMDQRKIQMQAEELYKKYNNQLPDSIAKRLDAEWEQVSKRQMDALKNGITENKDNLIPAYFIFNYMEVLGVDFIDNFLKDYKYKDDALLVSVFKMLEGEKRKAVGAQFIDFSMPDMDGKMHKLSEYVGKGNYVLIDFWASWCGPCRREMPNLVEIYKKYKSQGFEIVGVSLDRDAEAWKKGIEQLHITWPQMSDLKYWDCEGARLYAVSSIPHTVLIDGEGTILARGLHGEELQEKIAESLK